MGRLAQLAQGTVLCSINGTEVQIMWKEIAIVLLVLYVVRVLIDLYIKAVYKRIHNLFYSHAWSGLEDKIRKHQRICVVFSSGPWNKNVCQMYNGLCIALGSMALVNNNEVDFLNQLHNIKNEENFEIKHFILALYYRSKHDDIAAKRNYNAYLRCNRKNENIRAIMDYLFLENSSIQSKVDISGVIKTFQNPAIIKLLMDNGITGQGDGSPVP